MEQWVFWPTALVSLGSAFLMLTTPNAVRSALMLVVNFFTLAVFYVLLDAHFLAAVQIMVYAGAIMVLFLFVIMLLGVDRLDDLRESIAAQRVIALLAGTGLAGITVFTVRTAFEQIPFQGLEQANASGNVEGVGRLLFNEYLFPFEVTSLLLLLAAIGALVVGKRRRSERIEPEDEDA